MPCAVDSAYLVTNECMAIMSAMRKSSRLVHSGISAILGTQEDGDESLNDRLGLRAAPRTLPPGGDSPLIWGFMKLRSRIEDTPAEPLTCLELVTPFLAVVRAPSTTGAITSLALSALEKMIVLEMINAKMPGIDEGLYQLAMAITHCRFKATDQYEDDAVLVQLMGLLDKIVASDLGRLLCNKAVCELVETCLSMACQMRRGDALRRSVVSTVTGLMRMIFGRLSDLPDQHNPVYDEDVNLTIESPTPVEDKTEEKPEIEPGVEQPSFTPPPDDSQAVEMTPFETPAILETFRVLISVSNPQSVHAYTDSTRVMVLRILRVCFEMSGKSMARHPAFVELTATYLWKYLAQLVRREHTALVYESLQLVGLIMETGGQHYKLQFEFVMVYLLTALTPLTDLPRDTSIDSMFYDGIVSRPASVKPPSSTTIPRAPEIREIMVEAIARMAHGPAFFSVLFANYDCDTSQTDLCQDYVGFLCRNAYPDTATWSTASVPPLCLEAVLALLQRIVARAKQDQGQDVGEITSAKKRKELEILVTDEFNKSPKKGIEAMVKQGIILNDTPSEIAKFLRTSRRLHKGELGRYLANKKNKEVLAAFIEGFDFGGKRVDEALREFLCFFRLPGESGEIEPILDRFGQHYLTGEGNSEHVANVDAAFVLSIAVIMLNTDQHNPQVKARMTFDDFKRNLRGSNDNKDFDEAYLHDIYTTIKQREIVLPDEHDTDESFEYSWKQLLGGLPQASPYITTISPHIDQYVFSTVWRPIVSMLSFIFATATDDVVFSRVITAFRQAATLAAKFELPNALDHILNCLAKISTLTSGDLKSPRNSVCVAILVDGKKTHKVIVSDLSGPFGSDLKAQMASITLFRILFDICNKRSVSSVSPKGWELVARACANLYIYDLYVPMDLDRIPPVYTFERSRAGKSIGIFSALSSYLTASSDIPPEPSDEEVDAALGAQDCIKACKIDQVLGALTQACQEDASTTESVLEGILNVLPPSEEDFISTRRLLLTFGLRVSSGRPEFARKIAAAGDEGSDGLLPLRAAVISQEEELVNRALDKLQTADGLLDLEGLPLNNTRLWKLLETADTDRAVEFASKNVKDLTLPVLPAAEQALASLSTRGSEKALNVLYSLDQTRPTDAYAKYLSQLVRPCVESPQRAVRETAISKLQRLLLDDSTAAKAGSWQRAFEFAVIGLLEKLLKPDIFKRDEKGMEGTRQQAATLAGKVFLHNAMQSDNDIEGPWQELLRVLDRLLSSRRQPALHESVTEMLKNDILVMRMANKGSSEFWSQSEKQLKGFVPELASLVRSEPPQPVPAA